MAVVVRDPDVDVLPRVVGERVLAVLTFRTSRRMSDVSSSTASTLVCSVRCGTPLRRISSS